jgi:hypothetical protein
MLHMATMIYVLSDRRLHSIAEWQAAVDAEAFPLRFAPDEPDGQAVGNLRMQLRDKETEIECGFGEFNEVRETFGNDDFGRDWRCVIDFTWGSDFFREIASWMAATAYARATAGVVFDERQEELLTPDACVNVVRELERMLPERQEMVRAFREQLLAKS